MHDVFIAHASEDKDDAARPIAKALKAAGLDVWYDEFSLELGDSLRRTVDRGLADSRYGAVVLSPMFFAKDWPQSELDGLFAKEVGRVKTILPIWHEIDRDGVLERSPLLADRKAAKTASGIDHVVEEILHVVQPDRLHRTRDGLTVSVMPRSARLHTGTLVVRTPVVLWNASDVPVYAALVKVTIDQKDIAPDSVEVQPDAKSTSLSAVAGPIEASADIVRLNCRDSDDQPCIFLQFHTIRPRDSREFVIFRSVEREASVHLRITSFRTSPRETLASADQAFVPFEVSEEVSVYGIAIAMKRTQ